MSLRPSKDRDWIWVTPNGKPTVTLTQKQQEIFDLVCEGYNYDQIAHELDTSASNISKHMNAIRRKIGAKTNAHAVFKLT